MRISIVVAALLLPIAGWTAQSFTVQVSGTGKPVILIPGLSCSGEVWDDTVRHLNAEGYQTHTLTLAGFGGTPAIHSDSYLLTVRQDLAQYIKDQHLQKPVIIGHSLGGFLALWLDAENPELPGKVISVDGLPFLAGVMQPGASGDQAKQMAAGMKSHLMGEDDAQFQQGSRQSLESMITSPTNVDRELKVELTADRATMAEAMSELLSTDIRSDMGKVKSPTLVIGTWIAYKNYGLTHDGAVQLYEAQFGGNPDVKVVMSDTTKHFVQLDDPAWFYSQVDSFLGK